MGMGGLTRGVNDEVQGNDIEDFSQSNFVDGAAHTSIAGWRCGGGTGSRDEEMERRGMRGKGKFPQIKVAYVREGFHMDTN